MKVRASKVVATMSFFSDCRLSVKPVADPEKSRHSKRASIKRRADEAVLASTARAARCELSKLNQQILSKSTRIEELVSLKKHITEIEKAAKKSVPDAASLMDVTRLIQTIIEEENLNSKNESGGQICSQIK